ncbi:MAG: DUF1844 domain-containing protein [Planctomycetes bacterium]|nr:DUF1844 domain-containing protein [Planctomycetota bacterium]
MAEEKKEPEKKIIIDEDWKEEAKKEKETLAAQEDAEKKQASQQKPRGPLPSGDFAALVSMLVTQAFFALGELDIEGQEKKEPDLDMAKYNIDMLETLQEKTKGNLTEQEETVLENTLGQVRMLYVKVAE